MAIHRHPTNSVKVLKHFLAMLCSKSISVNTCNIFIVVLLLKIMVLLT